MESIVAQILIERRKAQQVSSIQFADSQNGKWDHRSGFIPKQQQQQQIYYRIF